MSIWGMLKDSNEHKTFRRNHFKRFFFHIAESLLVRIFFIKLGKKLKVLRNKKMKKTLLANYVKTIYDVTESMYFKVETELNFVECILKAARSHKNKMKI